MLTTGLWVCADNCRVTNGMLAPPPAVAITDTSTQLILLRCNRLSSSSRTCCSGSASSESNSARVTRTTDRYPGSSTGISVAVAADNRSLACRHSSRSAPSRPTAAVAPGSASSIPDSTWPSKAWSIRSPENSATLVVSSSGSKAAPESASVTLVPPPPRSTSTTGPPVLNPGLVCSEVSAATASDTSLGGVPFGESTGFDRRVARNARSVAAFQCAGTATAACAGTAPPTTPTIASSASTNRSSAG
ncbi:hypothetical protein MYFR107205_02540 [Mycolicibacterium frederiksbergense]